MAKPAEDPTDAIRRRAASFAGVDAGKACTQSSFKLDGQAFLFVGVQGGRCKAMFRLSASRPEAERLARERPADFQVGTGPWVTARFSAEAPLPKSLWERWLDESHALAAGKSKPVRKSATGRQDRPAGRRSPEPGRPLRGHAPTRRRYPGA